jgi:tRNA (guanine10-N2)-dimethyltransferase
MIYFVLGSQSALCKAELQAVLKNSVTVFESDTVVLAESGPHNPSELQDRLSGVIKIGYIIGELKEWNHESAAELIAMYAQDAAGKNKISFGLSVYDLGDRSMTRLMEKKLDALGQEVKKYLKTSGRPVRYVKAREPRLSSAVIETNGLLASAGEFVVLPTPRGVLIGQTQTIQDFRAWERRDFGRPARDAKSGMLPPKLARMMINLSGTDPADATLLDPFCGSGTVLMEGALMGFSQLIGSDISQKAIDDTQKNLSWLTKNFAMEPANSTLHTAPASTLPSLLRGSVDAIVTEVYLGPPRSRPLTDAENKKIETELFVLYEESFRALHSLLKSGARAVIAFPAFKTQDGAWHRLPLKSLLEKLGYRFLTNHLYFRADQLVARDIYVLTRK